VFQNTIQELLMKPSKEAWQISFWDASRVRFWDASQLLGTQRYLEQSAFYKAWKIGFWEAWKI